MTPLTILGIAVLAVLVVMAVWARFTGSPDDPESVRSELARMQLEDQIRAFRRKEFQRAYVLAKEELGEEPTIEQIFLTRDQLRTQEKLNGQT